MGRRFGPQPEGRGLAPCPVNDLAWLRGLFGLLMVLAIVVGAVVVVWLLSRRTPSPPSAERNRAVDELDALYARGEVTRDDYRQRRTDLLAPSPVVSPPLPGSQAPPA